MEFVIGIGIAIVITALFGRGRKKKQPTPEQLKRADEELITAVLSTINHDK